MQNDNPAFLTILGYVGLIYVFIADTFIFEETINGLQFLGIGIIFMMNLTLVCDKLRTKSD